MSDSMYRDLPSWIHAGDLIVINNTKVIPARLSATTETGATRELLLLEKHDERNFDPHHMRAMYRRKLHAGQSLTIGSGTVVVEQLFGDGTALIRSNENLFELAESHGSVPLPPYLHRQADAADMERYQTVFAKHDGSVAAPTASLNLTPAILNDLKQAGADIVELTLHVGLGTFMPIREQDVTKHTMHQEYFDIPAGTAEAIRTAKARHARVVAVGTTVTRTLEYAADQILVPHERTENIQGEADIFIYPGYNFKVTDCMVTNFHAPRSTVLMMAAAFAGWNRLKTAYDYAVKNGYAFLSYGDSMFIYS